jgi:hypothetical protein
VTKAVLKTGVREGCWFSMEVFDGGEDGKWTGKGKGVNDLEEFTRGMESFRRLLDECADTV